jgi:hypothetical protein
MFAIPSRRDLHSFSVSPRDVKAHQKIIDHWSGFENEAQLVKKIQQLMER